MKKFSIIAMVLAFTMMLSVVSFAAPAFVADEATYSDGSAIAEGYLTVEAGESSIDATINAASGGNYYGIILVTGDALPNAENTILYINQITAPTVAAGEASVVDFDVLPIIPTELKDEEGNAAYTLGDPLTLYISSNVAGDKLIKVPLVYDEEKATYTLGDVNADNKIDISDVGLVLNAYLEAVILDATQKLAADVAPVGNPDGKIDISDVGAVLNAYLGAITLN